MAFSTKKLKEIKVMSITSNYKRNLKANSQKKDVFIKLKLK
tara:strand:+ start:750 stop:872 length:123 start_codon:yes stop_codon:yes gene_type:complete